MSVTAVVCTLNRVESLPATLRSLRAQHAERVQVVVINGPSLDGTSEFLATCRDISLVDTAASNISVARNLGIRVATTDLVAFIDDDAVADPYWLSSLEPRFTDPALAAIGGPVLCGDGVSVQAGSSSVDCFGNVVITDATVPGIGRPGGWWTSYPTGTNAVFRRDALVEVGGFDEVIDYFHDETDVCRRLVDAGWRVTTVPNGFVHHGMLPGVIRPVNGGPIDRRPLVRSTTYFALRHAAPRAGGTATQKFIDGYLAEQVRLATTGTGAAEPGIRKELEGARDSGVAAATLAPLVRRASFFNDPLVARPTFDAEPEDTQRIRGSHIVLVCRWFDANPYNGIPQSYRLLASALAACGHIVRVVAASRQAHGEVELDRLPIVHKVAAEGASPSEWQNAVVTEVRSISDRWPVDLVIGPNWDSEALGLAGGAIPLVTTLHTPLSTIVELDSRIDPQHPQIQMLLANEDLLINASRGLLAATEAVLEEIHCSVIARRRSAIIPRGFVDTTIRRVALPEHYSVLMVGRCELRKGVDTLLGAWAEVVRVAPNAVLRVTGTGWDATAIDWDGSKSELLARFVADGSVVATGRLDQDALLREYANARVVVVPSRYESFGLVAAEAMRSGVPVIATNVGGLPAVVGTDAAAGLLVARDDAADLSRALLELLLDDERNESMGRAARRRFEERFTIDRMSLALDAAVTGWTGHDE